MNRRSLTIGLALIRLSVPTFAGTVHGTLYKDRNCPCCEGHARYLKANGIDVDVVPVDDIAAISRKAGIPSDYQGCHTVILDGDGYVVEGHVSAELIRKLLRERPRDVIGISLPGMPVGVPGMAGEKIGPYEVLAIHSDGKASVFASE